MALSLSDEISYLTAILSLIPNRLPPLGKNKDASDSSPPDSDSNHDDTDTDDMDLVPPNGHNFYSSAGTEETSAENALKQRALDRLAEVLARYKTDRNDRNNSNRDAKHVASVILVENANESRITFICSKNEGLDHNDIHFTGGLKHLLETIATSNVTGQLEKKSSTELVFKHIFDFQSPRIQFYSSVINDVFNSSAKTSSGKSPTSDMSAHLARLPIATRLWEDDHGYVFEFGPSKTEGAEPSNEAVDNISLPGDIRLVDEIVKNIRTLSGSSASVAATVTPQLVQSLYTIVRHPQLRPVLKSLLRQLLQGPNFRKAWNALLFLARMYYAAATLVDLVCHLKSTRVYDFIEMSQTFRDVSQVNCNLRSLTDVWSQLHLPQTTQDWQRFFEGRSKKFLKALRINNGVHAETQLVCMVLVGDDLPARQHEKVFPYVRCSRLCCFFCEEFIRCTGGFITRGSHEKVFARWALPAIAVTTDPAKATIRRFSRYLKSLICTLLDLQLPLPNRNLLAQSSASLSTTRGTELDAAYFPERPSGSARLLIPPGIGAVDGQVQFSPIAGKAGYAHFMAPDMPKVGHTLPIDAAEEYKINHERQTFCLETLNEWPPTRTTSSDLCQRPSCNNKPGHRCSSCWTRYCSPECQRRDWRRHVFICATPKRPNNADYLRGIVKRIDTRVKSGKLEDIHDSLLHLFADDDVCRAFGFDKVTSWVDATQLICLYNTVLSTCRSPIGMIQRSLESGRLGYMLLMYCEQYVSQAGGQSDCNCITWFLSRGAKELFSNTAVDDSTDDAMYEIWFWGFAEAKELLKLPNPSRDFNTSEKEVLGFFTTIMPSLWQLPNINSSFWIKFGFCYCKSFSQRQALADGYIALASSEATFDDIVSAYASGTMFDLMRSHGVKVPSLARQGIRDLIPTECQYAVYRLMIGVEHALSGRFCECFRMRTGRPCHRYFETHIESEADIGYGFHLTSPWERWQLLNFYKYVFRLSRFDPRAMAAAKENAERGSLEKYLDTLVPRLRVKLWNRKQASNIFFPNLEGKLTASTTTGEDIPHFHSSCKCKEHDVIGPPGISHGGLDHGSYCVSG